MTPKQPPMKRAQAWAVLARVSTAGQEDGRSLDGQVADGEKYAKRHGATDVRVYKGVESATGTKRDILERLLVDAESGKFGALVIQELTRLSRNPATMFMATERLKAAGVALHDHNGPITYDTPEGEFQVNINAVIGRFVARQGVEKSIKERVRMMREDGLPAAGRPPWGRRWDGKKGRYVASPGQRALLERAFKLIVQHKKSVHKAAATLKLPRTSLRKAIEQSSATEVTQRLSGATYTFKCDPLLTPAQHAALNRVITSHQITRPPEAGQYLLQGLVRCGHCGATMTGQSSTKDVKRYAFYRHPPATRQPACPWQAPAGLLEDAVLFDCTAMLRDNAALKAAIQQSFARAHDDKHDRRERLAEVQQEVKEADKDLERLLDRLVALDEGGEARKKLAARISSQEKKLTGLREEEARLKAEVAFEEIPIGTVAQIAGRIRALFFASGVKLSRAQQREFIRTMIGRERREDEQGIYIDMRRHAGKRPARWHYRIVGLLMEGDNYLTRAREGYAADLRPVGNATPAQLRRLADIASAAPSVGRHYTTGWKPRSVQSAMNPS